MKAAMAYVVAIWFAVPFGCPALSAHCLTTGHQRRHKVERTRGVFVSSSPSNASAYHTEILCLAAAPAPEGESKLTLIFCTTKCYCHNASQDSICYCCQNKGLTPPKCYDKLQDCQASCPVCNPKCPSRTAMQG